MDDHLILYSGNAETTGKANGLLTFYINNQYYTNARGSICDVQLTMVNASIGLSQNDACLVECDLPVLNANNTENSQFLTMNILSDSFSTQYVGNPPVYRTQARPQKLTFRLTGLDRQPFDLTGNVHAVFILKFSYENQQDEVNNFTSEMYNTLE